MQVDHIFVVQDVSILQLTATPLQLWLFTAYLRFIFQIKLKNEDAILFFLSVNFCDQSK